MNKIYVCIKEIVCPASGDAEAFKTYILWPKGSLAYFEETPNAEFWKPFTELNKP